MVYQRIPIIEKTDVSILKESLTFPTSKRVARNRFLKAALTECLCLYEPGNVMHGVPNQSLINVYEKWGHGLFGMILCGNIPVDANHLEGPGNAIIEKKLDSPERLEGFKKMAKAGKSDGALFVAQLSHAGRQTPLAINKTPFSASDIHLTTSSRKFLVFGKPAALSLEQIKTEIIDKFAYAAEYCYKAGFDGVQAHGAHGYLLAQFLSPTTNKRTDKYGGSLENRTRIYVDVYNAIRERVPAETGFIVGVKLNSVEFQNEGLETSDAVEAAKIIDKAGYDFIEISGGTYEKLAFGNKKDSTIIREAFFDVFAEAIKKEVKHAIVYLTGGFRRCQGMVASIKGNSCDGIGLGRPATSEPNFPKKVVEDDVQSCADDYLDKFDFTMSTIASSIQMIDMSKQSIAECNGDPCKGIMDLSRQEVSEQFKERMLDFFQTTLSLANPEVPACLLLDFELEVKS
uniref:Oxidored_FMN domain-containing protein n=1 Tax=Rhabditophanes sp. KR3021 TaxID=114890 RepID=A0AC35TYX6_9BILA